MGSVSFARATFVDYTRSVGVAEDRSRNAIEGSQMPCLGEDVLRSGLTSAEHCDEGDGR